MATKKKMVCHMCGAGITVPALSIRQKGRKTDWHFCAECAPKQLGVTPEEFRRLSMIKVSTEVWEVEHEIN